MRDSERQTILVNALARIASNLGMGSIRPSEADNASRPLRIAASEALEKTGYVYREYPSVAEDGWYLDGKLAGKPYAQHK